ncbi:MAG: hypothetical protein J6J31_07615 [Thermoguttaceae bacterium]|nr:hypothetical protein [Thermoguttaceae bacterium]
MVDLSKKKSSARYTPDLTPISQISAFLTKQKHTGAKLHICAGSENSTASNSMKQREQERNRSVQIGTLDRSLASRHQNRQERPNTDPAPQLFAMTNSRTHLSLFTTDLATTFSGYFCSHGKSPV